VNIDFLQKYRGKRGAVAVSGGADSVCLLQVFYENAEANGISLLAITCEHGIRKEASLRDLAFVKAFCAERNIPLYVFSENVPERAEREGVGLEEAGRDFRYECFAKILDGGYADFVATAHHRGDLAETVLFRLARGTSLAGISAIKERGGIIRPFLNVSKAEILQYLSERNISYVTDETNADETYSRNAIRQKVVPALEEVVRGAEAHIADFARRAGEDDSFLQTLAERAVKKTSDGIRIPTDLERPLFLRAAVSAIRGSGGGDYTEKILCEIEKLKDLQSGKKVTFAGIEVARERDEIVFYRPEEKFSGELPFAEGTFKAGAYSVTVTKEERQGALYCDFEKFPAGCVIRTRREGDLFTPFGGKEKPLKKFLTDRKIPARIGARLPLVAKGNTVYAVFGAEISDGVKITEQTARRMYLIAERNEE